MRRYLAIYMSFVRFGFSRAMEFRVDFLLRVVMDCVYYAVNLLFFRALLLHTSQIGGWNEPQVMVFVSSFILLDAVSMTIFSNNNHVFPALVNQGQLDYYLVRPVSPLFIAMMRDVAAASFMNLIIASGILGWAIHSYPGVFEPLNAFLYACALLMGLAVWQGMAVLLIYIPVFWTHSVSGFMDLNFALHHLAERPDGIFTQRIVRAVVTTVLPYAVMVSFPTRVLFGENVWQTLLHLLAVSIALWSVIGLTWKRALKAYASASS